MAHFKTRSVCALLTLFAAVVAPVALLAQTPADSSYPGKIPSNDIGTGYSYGGLDLGMTTTALLGGQNFFWTLHGGDSISRAQNSGGFWTYVPFNNLGVGVDFVGGLKAGLAI